VRSLDGAHLNFYFSGEQSSSEEKNGAAKKKNMKTMWEALKLDHLPTVDFLNEHWLFFKNFNDEGDYKVGVTQFGSYKGRYGSKSMHKCLSALSIFAICKYSIAIKIEAQMKLRRALCKLLS
jgi:hypothetical protein